MSGAPLCLLGIKSHNKIPLLVIFNSAPANFDNSLLHPCFFVPALILFRRPSLSSRSETRFVLLCTQYSISISPSTPVPDVSPFSVICGPSWMDRSFHVPLDSVHIYAHTDTHIRPVPYLVTLDASLFSHRLQRWFNKAGAKDSTCLNVFRSPTPWTRHNGTGLLVGNV